MSSEEHNRRLNELVQDYRNQLEENAQVTEALKNKVVALTQIVQRIESSPLGFGVLVGINNNVEPFRFLYQDECIVVDQSSPYFDRVGKIISSSPAVDENGLVTLEFSDGISENFQIGVNGTAQVRLAGKSDGTKAFVMIDGKLYEVQGVSDLDVKTGDCVKVELQTKQIIGFGDIDFISGSICTIVAITGDGIEVEDKGEKRVVTNLLKLEIEEGDRVLIDSSNFLILKKMPQNERYNLKSMNVDWSDVGGLEEAKKECRDIIELPYQHPEIFEFYNKKRPTGILLHGAPGNGKTLLVRAMSTALAKLHNSEVVDTGCAYFKSPELLSKWVGQTEAEIRIAFDLARQHFRRHGYPQLMIFDEFEALAPQRGSRRSSDVSDTIVPMFLGEMDGANSQQTLENPIVVMITNRPSVLDQAIIRRVSTHVKVERPNVDTAIAVLKIHTKDTPFKDGADDALFFTVANDIFGKTRTLYRINNEHDFTFGDCVSGAMIESICEKAKMEALYRDIANKTQTGLTLKDFRTAVDKIYLSQRGLNHAYDLEDFAEKLGIQAQNMQVDRVQLQGN